MTTKLLSTTWHTLVGELELDPGEFLLYLDPHGLDDVESENGEIVTVDDRWQFRRLVEQRLRRFGPSAPPLLIHLRIPDLAAAHDLPFDARSFPSRVLDVRLPPQALLEVRQLPPRAVEILTLNRSLQERLFALARELTGLAWPPAPDMAVTAAVRLARSLGPGLRQLLGPTCPPGAASRILAADDPMAAVGQLLTEWSQLGANHPDDTALRAAAEDLSHLVEEQQTTVSAAPMPESLPKILRDAVREADAAPEVVRLLDALPPDGTSLESWISVSEAWSRVRWSLAALPPTPETAALEQRVWARWDAFDGPWNTWLKAQYGLMLTRNVLRPASVHQVAPFLASQVVERGSKVLLLVLDGLGVAQWQHLVSRLSLDVLEDRRLLACLPTMTTVSRQAIFAGALPSTFPETIDRTGAEKARWRSFWLDRGLKAEQIHHHRTDGGSSAAWSDPPDDAVAIGMAVNAVDNLMHGVAVNGDYQFYAGVQTWLNAGFLERAADWAARRSAQLWITSDHGNLPCLGLDLRVPDEGVRVMSKGMRSRIYGSSEQRASAGVPGCEWTPPGFPEEVGAPLFAPGRTFYRRTGGAITHGGLSLDEVIVPFSRIA